MITLITGKMLQPDRYFSMEVETHFPGGTRENHPGKCERRVIKVGSDI